MERYRFEMYKILIIDDSKFTVKVLTDILKDTYQIISTTSGREGIRLAREEKPSLILLDIEMPEINGFDVLKILKEYKDTEAIPVIFLTGLIDSEYEEKGFLYGAVDYIVKPYNCNVVKVRVKTHINLSEYRKKIEKQLNVDTLTDVYNRRGFEKYMEDISQKAISEGFVLNCILFDIDFFKKVNDTYGHLEGDVVLQKVAAILNRYITSGKGYIARYGGEEFSAVIPWMTRAEVNSVMDKIYKEVHKAKMPNRNSDTAPYVTLSAGIAGKTIKDMEEARQLFKTADDMLYKSKKEGRDRYTWYEE